MELNYYPWHEQQKAQLLSYLQQQRLPHALLLQGISGLGKQIFAKVFAKTLLCKQAATQQQSCNQCQSCHLFAAGTHPDVYFIQREQDAKFIAIDQIRELSAKLTQTSYFHAYRVAIIDDAKYLHAAAANALLKTLEEPSAKTLLILITEQQQHIPATLRSRCQTIHFLPPKVAAAKNWLQQHWQEQLPQAEIILKLAQGAPLRALTYVQDGSFKLRQQLLEALHAIALDKANPLTMIASFTSVPLSIIFFYWQLVVMDIIRIRIALPTSACVNMDYLEFLTNVASHKKASDWLEFLDNVIKLQRAQLSVALNQQLVLEKLFTLWFMYTT